MEKNGDWEWEIAQAIKAVNPLDSAGFKTLISGIV